jgi:hypothetical protein
MRAVATAVTTASTEAEIGGSVGRVPVAWFGSSVIVARSSWFGAAIRRADSAPRPLLIEALHLSVEQAVPLFDDQLFTDPSHVNT